MAGETAPWCNHDACVPPHKGNLTSPCWTQKWCQCPNNPARLWRNHSRQQHFTSTITITPLLSRSSDAEQSPTTIENGVAASSRRQRSKVQTQTKSASVSRTKSPVDAIGRSAIEDRTTSELARSRSQILAPLPLGRLGRSQLLTLPACGWPWAARPIMVRGTQAAALSGRDRRGLRAAEHPRILCAGIVLHGCRCVLQGQQMGQNGVLLRLVVLRGKGAGASEWQGVASAKEG